MVIVNTHATTKDTNGNVKDSFTRNENIYLNNNFLTTTHFGIFNAKGVYEKIF
jgi:hypothetical protein